MEQWPICLTKSVIRSTKKVIRFCVQNIKRIEISLENATACRIKNLFQTSSSNWFLFCCFKHFNIFLMFDRDLEDSSILLKKSKNLRNLRNKSSERDGGMPMKWPESCKGRERRHKSTHFHKTYLCTLHFSGTDYLCVAFYFFALIFVICVCVFLFGCA